MSSVVNKTLAFDLMVVPNGY